MYVNSSELVQRIGINEIAESMMAFNTNYKDTGLFGVYAIAKVGLSSINLTLYVCFHFWMISFNLVCYCYIHFTFPITFTMGLVTIRWFIE